MAAFAQDTIDLALEDHQKAAKEPGTVFFDRGIVDAASAVIALKADSSAAAHLESRLYCRDVFLAPPWPEIYKQDRERRHEISDAVAEYERLISAYAKAGYSPHILAKTSVVERADFIIDTIF